MVNDAMAVEHEIQKQVLERLKLDWPPGEPFYAVVEDEIQRLRTILGGMADLPTWAEEMGELQRDNQRLRRFLEAIEAGFGKRRSAAEMASEARAALDGALEPQP